MEKKLTNRGPLREPADKHSISTSPDAHAPGDGRIADACWFRSPPFGDGGESDRSFVVRAQALDRAVRAPAGWPQHHNLARFGKAHAAGTRRPVRWFWVFWPGWSSVF